MPTPDYSTWHTKQQAADAIGVSTKTVEQLAKDRRIEQAAWRPQGRGAERAVYNPDDVARVAVERRPEAKAFVLPAVTTPANGNGHPTSAGTAVAATRNLDRFNPAGPEAARSFLEAMLTAILAQRPATSESSERSPALFLTVAEAAALTGLTQAYLLRAIEAGTLKAIRDRGWRIRRRDLEQF